MQKNIKLALSYDDVLLVPQYSKIKSRNDVDLSTQITPHIKLALPFISSNMSSITDAKFAIALGKLGGLGVLPRFMTQDAEADMVSMVKRKKIIVAAAVGVKDDAIERAKCLVKAGADLLVMDVAHGHMAQAIIMTKKLRTEFGQKIGIISGNVATGKAARDLFNAGADCVKVGIGPGSTCITRTETGCGVPQISAVMDCATEARILKKTLICDGGMKNSGDIVKGLAAGASAIMTGHLFAGLEETAGKTVIKNGSKFKEYNGSTSIIEKSKRTGTRVKHIEGVSSFIPFKGTLKPYLERVSENVRSGFSYVGAANITQLWKKAEFVQVSTMGYKESGFHDVILNTV